MKKRFTSILLAFCLTLILPMTVMAQTAVTLTHASPTADIKVGSGVNGRVAITVTAPANGAVTLQTSNVGAFVQPRLYDKAGKQLATTAAPNSNIKYTVTAGQTQTIYAGTGANAAANYTIIATFPSGMAAATPTPAPKPATSTTTTPAATPAPKPATTPTPTPTPTPAATPAPTPTTNTPQLPTGISKTTITAAYNVPDVLYGSTGRAIRFYNSEVPGVTTFVGNDGVISVCGADDATKTAYIYEYSADLKPTRTLRLTYPFQKFGTFTKDPQGNFYVFSGEEAEEGEFTRENTELSKYNSSGNKTGAFRLPVQTKGEPWAKDFSGIKQPFRSSPCRMEVSGDLIAVYFGRLMLRSSDGKNHQASYGFILNKNNFQVSTMSMSYAGHSFNQYVLPIENGFVFADHGDANPNRSFIFNINQNGKVGKRLFAFTFKGNSGDNPTFAQMGGLAKTSKGYIFAGTYEKNTVYDSSNHADSRNLFVLTFDDNLSSISAPTWLTNYTNKETHNAVNPKIAALGSGRYLLMWELWSVPMKYGYPTYTYVTTYIRIIDENGKQIGTDKELPGIRLNTYDILRSNPSTGAVYWVINNGTKELVVYSFKP